MMITLGMQKKPPRGKHGVSKSGAGYDPDASVKLLFLILEWGVIKSHDTSLSYEDVS